MPTVSLSISTATVTSDTASAKAPDAGQPVDFLAFLNINGAQANAAGLLADNTTGNDGASSRHDNPNQDTQNTPPAAPMSVATPIINAAKPVVDNSGQNQGTVQKPAANTQDNAPRNSDQNTNTTPVLHTNNAPDASSRNTSPSNAQSPTSPQTTGNGNTDTTTPTDTGTTDKPEKQLHSSLQDELGNIDQILLAIIQALSGGAAATTTSTTATAATDSTTTPTTATGSSTVPAATDPLAALAAAATTPAPQSSADLLVQTLAAATPALPAAPVSAAALTTSEITLLKDIQATLQLMQQMLQKGSDTSSTVPADTLAAQTTTTNTAPQAPQTAAPDNSAATLQALTATLQQDMGQLSDILKQQNSSNASPSLSFMASLQTVPAAANSNDSSTATLPAETPAPISLAAFLKNSIAQARSQLQKLKTDNETIFAQARSNFQAQLSDAAQQFKDALSANTNTPATAAAQAATTSAAPLAVATPVNPFTDVSQLNAAPVAVLAAGQSTSDNTSDNNSGNGGNQGQSNAASGVSSGFGQAQQTGNAAANSFSKMLGHATQASVLEQVSFQVKTAIGDGSSRIRIQLDPGDLGKLDIKLNVGSDGKTGVVVTADNASTLDLLQRDAQGLMRALNNAGLSTDGASLSFNLRGDQQNQNQGSNQQAALTYQKSQPDDETDDPINAMTRSYVVNLAEGLDIKI